MGTVRRDVDEGLVGRYQQPWVAWPVAWSAVWVGALTALATALIIGLIGVALGAHELVPPRRVVRVRDFGFGAAVFSVVGALVAFGAGGWVASKIAGVRRAESAMLHGAVVWLLAVPLLLILAALGAGGYFGGWYGGLAGTPTWVTPPSGPVDPDAALAARNSALGAITALLLGLIGSVIGGWLGSRKPMASYDDRTPSVTTGRPVV
jgi:hypothetical protein